MNKPVMATIMYDERANNTGGTAVKIDQTHESEVTSAIFNRKISVVDIGSRLLCVFARYQIQNLLTHLGAIFKGSKAFKVYRVRPVFSSSGLRSVCLSGCMHS